MHHNKSKNKRKLEDGPECMTREDFKESKHMIGGNVTSEHVKGGNMVIDHWVFGTFCNGLSLF
jgi:hypothetical protein